MPKLEPPVTELTVVIRDSDYVVFATPLGESPEGPKAIEIATIKVKCLDGKEAYEQWRDFVVDQYTKSVARCFDVDPKDFTLLRSDKENRN